MAFSEAQKEAITFYQGPAMVLAGPGSGKTTVITHRTKYLIEKYQVPPREILVVTFTKAAAEEMKSRFLALRGEGRTQVRFGTFHSVFFEILKLAYRYTAANIAAEDKKYAFLKEITGRMDLEIEDEADFLKSISQEISTVKAGRIPLEHYYSTSISDEIFRSIYRQYQERMEKEALLDYDDLMVYTWELLTARADILQAWQKRYRYILIDEFQDISKLQYDIIRLLAAPEDNLFIVGDDDQSIYRFRGAKPEIMLHFPKEFPGCRKIILDHNFRCPGSVMEAASKVIGRNVVRFEKNIRVVKNQGEPVQYLKFRTQTEECLGLIRLIQKYIHEGHSYDSMAVLYRNHMDARMISQRLMEYNIPFRMKDQMPNLFEHWIARNLLAYLKAAHGDKSRGTFLQIMNRPKRYIGRECLDGRTVDLEQLRTYYDDKYWVVERIDKLESDLRALKRMDPYTAVSYIRHAIGYEEYLESYAQYRKIMAEELFDVADQIQESAKGFQTFEEWQKHIEQYSEMLKEQQISVREERSEITLCTLHSSKGLEFPIVFIIDVNEGIIPYKKAVLASDVEEERRMFYVGMTRASERLHICSIKEKNGRSVKDSPFLTGL